MSFTNTLAWTQNTLTTTGQTISGAFAIQAATEVSVIKTATTGIDTILSGSDYNITNLTSVGFDCVLNVSAGGAGDVITIYRNLPLTQPNTFVTNGSLPAKTVEASLDRMAQEVQFVKLMAERSLRLPFTSAALGDTTLALNNRKSTVLGFDSTGAPTLIANSSGGTFAGPATGDLSGTYPSPIIGANKVTYAKFQQVAANSFLGNNTGVAANAVELSATQSRALLGLATTDAPTFAGLVGVSTNSSAVAGQIGEIVITNVAVGSAISLVTTVAANVASVSLTAGDWEVSGMISFHQAATTVGTYYAAALNSASASLPNHDQYNGFGGNFQSVTSIDTSLPTPMVRFSLASTTTIFLIAQSQFTTSTLTAYGYIRARRVR